MLEVGTLKHNPPTSHILWNRIRVHPQLDITINGVQLRSPNGKVYTLTAGDDGKLKLSTEGEDTNGDKGKTTHS